MRRDRGSEALHKAYSCRRGLCFRRPCQNAMHSLLLALSLLRLFLCSPIYVLLFLVPSMWFPSICIPILPSISLHHLLPQLSLFSASFSYNALFSQKHRSMKTASPQSTLVLLSVFLCLSFSHSHTHMHTQNTSAWKLK